MRKVLFLLLSLAMSSLVMAQKNGSVKGVIFDTLAKQPVSGATITVLEKKDSSLVSFTMTDGSGKFELKGIPNGEYRLLVTHVSYHNSNTFFTIAEGSKEKDLGQVAMNDVSKVLSEVVVTNEAPPVTLINDTIQYNAGSFRTVPNANVEQLLKKLPGVKVEKDGSITAQGEKVNKVLVDGKEFFGNDPKIATRNLPADAIDKVQVYDKQSDQAQLTGFDDGNHEKTINLKLKKDKKKGVFGKISAGAGDQERYEGRFNVNSFKGARQMSAIGMGNNTNAEGFSFMDILNFSGGLGQMQQNGGNMSITMSAADAASLGLGNSQGGGIKTAWGGGVNYNNIIGDKLDFQSNYFYNRFNPNTRTNLSRQNFIGSNSNFYNENTFTDNLNNSHRFNLTNLYQIDSFHSLKIVPSLSIQNTRNNSQRQYSTTSDNMQMINEGVSNNLSTSEGFNFRNDIIFRKKFRTKGRTFSASLNTTINKSEGEGRLEAITNFYNAGNIFKRDTLNQRNTSDNNVKGYTARAVYTEPLWTKSLMEFSVSKSRTKSIAEKITYNYNKATGKFDDINEQLTNDFENVYGFTNAGFRMRKQARKFNYSWGITWQNAELEGKIISGIKDSLIRKDFTNLLPNASFKYNFTRFKSLGITYATMTQQPSLSQLQPVPDNSNPLYIRLGNPDLKQEFSHMIRTNVALITPYKNKSLFVNANVIMTDNKIVSYDSVDLATGIRISQPINVNGVYNINGNVAYGFPLRFMNSSVRLSSNVLMSKNIQFVNKQQNVIRTLALGPSINLDINATKTLTLGLGGQWNANKATYSLSSVPDNNFLSQEYEASADWQLPKNFFLSTDFTYSVNSQLAEGYDQNIALWNASLSKQFLKYNRGELKLSVRDILNENLIVSRTTNPNYIEDKQVNSLRRFFMLSFTYSLSKSGLGQPGGSGGMRVMR